MEVIKNLTDALFLRKQKHALEKELVRLEEQYCLTKEHPEYGSSDDENAQEVEVIQENLGLQRNLKNIIKDTKAAIKKIEKEKYGICDICRGPIEPGRLKAFPVASMCVTCANKKFRKR
ncbi:TPA: hypothetical protein DD449_01340 [Candidatus Berkelbacteria bacterium]|uniref:DnaK suppressor protein-like protein n=1 Tax=Berkelbacteria bacterium GW2011_GWE1_39_12 TaxID=1618337 RepID=A0A0G4B6G1_9BACT|nr:MAG: DnaK suppressor protein-like protein [Berkelbacteria bacterium GW2011_GWE1_39_12]HBO60315.1 hypothetical protein [Candidatus Berkelbacteria bacterium]